MAPLDPVSTLGSAGAAALTVALGFGFGFTLERAGFGDSRRLAAQFYLTELRVLKVMFTAIVTAMVLLLWGGALGLVDLARLDIQPTYLASAVVGGFLLGLGFIVGGYCPGTSLVAAATLKLDGIFFVFGVGAGLFVFGETVPWFWDFWKGSGFVGVVTLPSLLGVDPGWVALGVVVMALGAFWGAEKAESFFGARASGKEGR